MTIIIKELNGLILGDRKLFSEMKDLKIVHLDLIAASRTGVLFHGPGQDDKGLDKHLLSILILQWAYCGWLDHSLYHASGVSK